MCGNIHRALHNTTRPPSLQHNNNHRPQYSPWLHHTPPAPRHHIDTMRSRFTITEDGYATDSSTSVDNCALCHTTDPDLQCTGTHVSCTRTAHSVCAQFHGDTPWICAHCSETAPPHTIPQHIIDELTTQQTPIYTASDGSVRDQGTPNCSSTFGVHLTSATSSYFTHGRKHVNILEASSLRVELEGLICAYQIIPAHLDVIHAVDNTAAIHIHNLLISEGINDPFLLRQPYKATIVRLANAIHTRGAHLPITHTHLHLEHKHSTNNNLNGRHLALAGADAAADLAHPSDILPHNNDGTGNFPLIAPMCTLEKQASTYLKGSFESRWGSRLSVKTMEGALHRAHIEPHRSGTTHTR